MLIGESSEAEKGNGPARPMAKAQGNVVCLCHFCRTWVVFQPVRAGETVNCPHCLMSTVLYLPGAPMPDWREAFPFEFRTISWGGNNQGYRCVEGELVMLGTKDLAWIRVRFLLHDWAETVIGEASDCLLQLKAGSEWRFRAPVFEPLVVRASLPIVSTEFGSVDLNHPVAPSAVEKEREARGHGKTPSPVIPERHANTVAGKARTAAAPVIYQAGVKPHWSMHKKKPGVRKPAVVHDKVAHQS